MSGCMSQESPEAGACSCGGKTSRPDNALRAESVPNAGTDCAAVARVNGVPLHAVGERIDEETLRQRACTELLRQEAQLLGLLGADDTIGTDGATSLTATEAIEALLDSALQLPTPDEAACKRHFEAHRAQYARGERVHARHILFSVTPGIDVQALRKRAEQVLIEVRAEPSMFKERASQLSNCPTGATGGDLGALTREDCAPEFARELFGQPEVGVLPRLVHSRFGLHIVEVLAREAGDQPAFEQVRGAVVQALERQVLATSLRQYLQQLAGRASLEGVDLDAASSPLAR